MKTGIFQRTIYIKTSFFQYCQELSYFEPGHEENRT
jgi:hypothetical protein